MAVARQWHSKHFSVAPNTHTTVKELLDMVFSVQSMLRLYNEDHAIFKVTHIMTDDQLAS
jgi:hypothetical protein